MQRGRRICYEIQGGLLRGLFPGIHEQNKRTGFWRVKVGDQGIVEISVNTQSLVSDRLLRIPICRVLTVLPKIKRYVKRKHAFVILFFGRDRGFLSAGLTPFRYPVRISGWLRRVTRRGFGGESRTRGR